MGFNLDALLLAIHLLAAAAWFGAGWYHQLMVAPAIREAGRDGLGVLKATARRGGGGKWFGPASIATILSGALLYARLGVDTSTLSGGMLAAGAALGVAAFVMGPTLHLPAERALHRALAHNDEAAIRLHAGRLGRHTSMAGYLVSGAFLLMSLRHVVM